MAHWPIETLQKIVQQSPACLHGAPSAAQAHVLKVSLQNPAQQSLASVQG
jgi:hypothetical protein